jgi:type II secretory ATPase GspE/PulE/Tfp pilus assembly ATPase PilB-like protein
MLIENPSNFKYFKSLAIDDFYSYSAINSIEVIANKNGMQTLIEDGIKKAMQGITTIDELSQAISM